MSTEFIELAGEVNWTMPYFCAEKVARALNDEAMPVRGSRVAIIGVSYKAGVGDVRASPALKIMSLLAERGAQLDYHDPYVPTLPAFGLESRPLEDVLADADVAVIVTVHPDLDPEQVVREAGMVVDFRGVTRGFASAPKRFVRL